MARLRRWVLAFARWLEAWADPVVETEPPADPVELAVRGACGLVGLPVEHLRDDFDLGYKAPEVLHRAVKTLGQAHGLRTYGDVVRALKGQA